MKTWEQHAAAYQQLSRRPKFTSNRRLAANDTALNTQRASLAFPRTTQRQTELMSRKLQKKTLTQYLCLSQMNTFVFTFSRTAQTWSLRLIWEQKQLCRCEEDLQPLNLWWALWKYQSWTFVQLLFEAPCRPSMELDARLGARLALWFQTGRSLWVFWTLLQD